MTARPLQISNGFDLSEHNATLQKKHFICLQVKSMPTQAIY